MEKELRVAIKSIICDLMDETMNEVLVNNSYDKNNYRISKSLYGSLVPRAFLKASYFEEHFIKQFSRVWEKLAVAAATVSMGEAHKGYTLAGQGRLKRIQEVLNKLEHKNKGKEKIRPDWSKELSYILEGKEN